MHLAVVGLSHHTAPVEIRERLSIPEHSLQSSLITLRADDQVLEASILSTCNRLEIYSLLRQPQEGVAAIQNFLSLHSGLPGQELNPHLFALHHEEAIQHLLRVSAGLDSLVLGEGQGGSAALVAAVGVGVWALRAGGKRCGGGGGGGRALASSEPSGTAAGVALAVPPEEAAAAAAGSSTGALRRGEAVRGGKGGSEALHC